MIVSMLQKRRGRPPLTPEEKLIRAQNKEETIGYNLQLPIPLHDKFNKKIHQSGTSKKEIIESLIRVYLNGVYGTIDSQVKDSFMKYCSGQGKSIGQGLEEAIQLLIKNKK